MLVPAAGAGVPGAPADWDPPDGTEAHLPVLFLDLNADDLSTGEDLFGFIRKCKRLAWCYPWHNEWQLSAL